MASPGKSGTVVAVLAVVAPMPLVFVFWQVVLRHLIKLSTSSRDIRIVEESAEKFIDIGVLLLTDDTGARVRGIANSNTALHGDEDQAVRRYTKNGYKKMKITHGRN